MIHKQITRILPAIQTTEGDGLVIRRAFPTQSMDHLDPFLLLDHFGPRAVPPGDTHGVPPHPHRGFQTVTYMLSGEFEHRDSEGNHGLLRPGDLQWMIAGDGVVHSEMPSEQFQKQGGTLHGFQLWVNLPASDKRMPPKYQDIPSAKVPEIKLSSNCEVRVLAGEFSGLKGVVETRVPVLYLHVKLTSGSLEVPIPTSWNTMAYVFKGTLSQDDRELHEGSLVLYGDEGASVRLQAGNSGCEVLLIAGEPLKEPVVRYGPFVMNTEEEIYTAVSDYRAGKLGNGRLQPE